jgi:predicted transcriptional regulator
MNVILSIKPKFAEAIFAGKKEVEFRKTIFKGLENRVSAVFEGNLFVYMATTCS